MECTGVMISTPLESIVLSPRSIGKQFLKTLRGMKADVGANA
jgi:hypothetical protein